MIRQFLAAASFACIAAPAFAQSPGADCLRNAQIYSYKPGPDNRSLIVTDNLRKRYRVSFVSKCYNLQRQYALGFQTFGVGGLACVEKGDSVVLRDPVGPTRCLIDSVVPYRAVMEQAGKGAAAQQ